MSECFSHSSSYPPRSPLAGSGVGTFPNRLPDVGLEQRLLGVVHVRLGENVSIPCCHFLHAVPILFSFFLWLRALAWGWIGGEQPLPYAREHVVLDFCITITVVTTSPSVTGVGGVVVTTLLPP